MIKSLWTRNILYYQQAVAQVLAQGSYVELLAIISPIFDLSVANNSGSITGSDGWCFIQSINAKQKILLNVMIPTLIMIYIIILLLVSNCKKNGKITFCSKREINFSKSLIAILLLLIGNILTVLFQILHCQQIGDTIYHFYFAWEKCFSFTWFVAIVILVLILAIFTIIQIRLFCLKEKRQEKDQILSHFVSKYKPKYYYWEYIIFIRRICISIFSVSVTNNNYKIIFYIAMCIFLLIQYKCKPFIIPAANTMEFILILCFIFLVVLISTPNIDHELKLYLITTLVIFPLVLFIYFLIQYQRSASKYEETLSDKEDEDDDGIQSNNESDEDEEEKFEMDIDTNETRHKYLMVSTEMTEIQSDPTFLEERRKVGADETMPKQIQLSLVNTDSNVLQELSPDNTQYKE